MRGRIGGMTNRGDKLPSIIFSIAAIFGVFGMFWLIYLQITLVNAHIEQVYAPIGVAALGSVFLLAGVLVRTFRKP
jgi:hypothetical protein